MAAPTLPYQTRLIDNQFLDTWYEIRDAAIDQVLDATVMFLAFREMGAMDPQAGSEFITRKLKVDQKAKQNVTKGSILTQSVIKSKTKAFFNWGYTTSDVNRSLIEDQQNSGPFKIDDYVADRIEEARDALVQGLEADLFKWEAFDVDQIQGIWDLIPTVVAIATDANYGGAGTGDATSPTRAAGTLGGVSRANTFWQTKNKAGTAPSSINLVSDMRTFWNEISNNQEPPNFIICDQDLYEFYHDEVGDKQQIVRSAFDQTAADLGFQTLTYMGATMSWTSKLSASDKMLFLNMNWIDIVFDPNYWFDMTEWMATPDGFERVAYIFNAMQLVFNQPRRFGLLDYNASTNA